MIPSTGSSVIQTPDESPSWHAAFDTHLAVFYSLQEQPGSYMGEILFGNRPPATWRFEQFVYRLAQWDNLVALWDGICLRLKQEGRPWNSGERALLELCLSTYNGSLDDHQATWQVPAEGGPFVFDIHQTLSPSGVRVERVHLPGLVNPAGTTVKKSLVTIS
jgi:hypothetical protein